MKFDSLIQQSQIGRMLRFKRGFRVMLGLVLASAAVLVGAMKFSMPRLWICASIMMVALGLLLGQTLMNYPAGLKVFRYKIYSSAIAAFLAVGLLLICASALAQPPQSDPEACRKWNRETRELAKELVGKTELACKFDEHCALQRTLDFCGPHPMNVDSAGKWKDFFTSPEYRVLAKERPICPIPSCANPGLIKAVCAQSRCVIKRGGPVETRKKP